MDLSNFPFVFFLRCTFPALTDTFVLLPISSLSDKAPEIVIFPGREIGSGATDRDWSLIEELEEPQSDQLNPSCGCNFFWNWQKERAISSHGLLLLTESQEIISPWILQKFKDNENISQNNYEKCTSTFIEL